MSDTIAKTLDLKGLSCPMPIAKTAQAIRDLRPGELLESLATDPGSVPDFNAWFTLVRNDVHVTGDNWMQKMMSMMNRGGTDHLGLSQMNFAGMGPAMMKKLAEEHHVASPQELLEVARDLGVHLVPCQMTMDLMGLRKNDLIEGLEEPAGATTALLEAQDAVTLFI